MLYSCLVLLVLRRMEDLKSSEQRATVEDLMYASVLEKFMDLKVEMMPRYPSRCQTLVHN